MKILLTAFDPFGGEKVNPALEAVKSVRAPEGVELVKLTVPTVFGKSIDTVLEAMRREKPDAVLSIGQAGGRTVLTPERVAVNFADASIPDNEGNQPRAEKIFEDGSDSYFATVPVDAIVSAVKQAGVPASVSMSAGTYVCNHLMYGVLYYEQKEFPGMLGGFIHIPFSPEQVSGMRQDQPSMSVDTSARGIEAALRAIRG